MSTTKKFNSEINNLPPLMPPEKSEKVSLSGRVDINQLLARVRIEKEKESKINLVFFLLFTALILVIGIILSF
tara:strand:+ start:264 stop:482 length:219 start_codon:yes stop_codon:yes gene_type:complete